MYPRVKLIDIFDNDNLKYAMEGRQLNNYSVTDSEVTRREYSRAVAPDYFLSDVGADASATLIKPAGQEIIVRRGLVRFSTWARCYADDFSVVYSLNGQRFSAMPDHGPREIEVGLKPGTHRLAAAILDNKGRVAARTEAKILAG